MTGGFELSVKKNFLSSYNNHPWVLLCSLGHTDLICFLCLVIALKKSKDSISSLESTTLGSFKVSWAPGSPVVLPGLSCLVPIPQQQQGHGMWYPQQPVLYRRGTSYPIPPKN
ncbi:hypothetical protein J1605_012633 [Eschrichtius robustus]|uniref:Uncharacterized protein n=1 Tax=Eschrichtius robustus TaxID=9764 RepID=A0AB34GIH2_ESCRO|nr:hypothetical protein J1605_012633 [Eschrichtius robustus]